MLGARSRRCDSYRSPKIESMDVDVNVDSVPEELENGTGAAAADGVTPLETAIAERDRLAAEKAELLDRNLRAQAEFQNFRKRAERERVEWVEYASTEAVRALLPMLDD